MPPPPPTKKPKHFFIYFAKHTLKPLDWCGRGVVSLLIASGYPKYDGGFDGAVDVGRRTAVTVQVGAWP